MHIDNFRIIFCSSINDEKIRNEVIKTWIDNNGNNPPFLNEVNQMYYFYYNKLFVQKKGKSLAYKLFHNKYKYIKKLGKEKNLDFVYNKIINKTKNFLKEHNNDLINYKLFTLTDVFMFLKKYINIKFNRSFFYEIIPIIPLKYFSTAAA